MRYLLAVLAVVVVAVGAAFAYATRYPEIEAISPPQASDFPEDLIERGEILVSIGDCVACHTRPGGEAFAGGLALETPFGTIHSTNITPDAETGIGTWSLEAFRRAMHEGVDREGHYLYPAFPYDHFTRVSDDDIEAIYAFLMSQEPVSAPREANGLAFPFNQRILLAGWNLLFLDNRRFEPDPQQSEEWNRGAYLAEGLGHCGACHTPRNLLGAVDANRHLAGADVESWHAPALDSSSPAPAPWTADALVNYFLDGWDGDHGIAAGPMTPVVDGLAAMSEDDAYALAEYVLSFQDQTEVDSRIEEARAFAEQRDIGGSATPASGPENLSDPSLAAGQATFMRICANCHRAGTNQAPLALTSTVNGPDPANLIHIIAEGIRPPEASFDRSMPAFGNSLSGEDMANLVRFVRAHFSRNPPWTNVEERIAEIHK